MKFIKGKDLVKYIKQNGLENCPIFISEKSGCYPSGDLWLPDFHIVDFKNRYEKHEAISLYYSGGKQKGAEPYDAYYYDDLTDWDFEFHHPPQVEPSENRYYRGKVLLL